MSGSNVKYSRLSRAEARKSVDALIERARPPTDDAEARRELFRLVHGNRWAALHAVGRREAAEIYEGGETGLLLIARAMLSHPGTAQKVLRIGDEMVLGAPVQLAQVVVSVDSKGKTVFEIRPFNRTVETHARLILKRGKEQDKKKRVAAVV